MPLWSDPLRAAVEANLKVAWMEKEIMKIDGACHCGFITYEADIDPQNVAICHCTDCQTLSGSAFRTVVRANADAFRITSGKPKVYLKTAESGNKRQQTFCPECGTPIYAAAQIDPPSFNIRLGTCRQRAQLAPKTQVWGRSALKWLSGLSEVRVIEKQP